MQYKAILISCGLHLNKIKANDDLPFSRGKSKSIMVLVNPRVHTDFHPCNPENRTLIYIYDSVSSDFMLLPSFSF